LQTFERLQEATAFVRQNTGKNMRRMKQYYDSSVKPQSYEVGEKVLLYNLRKQRGKFAKWQIMWTGPYTVERRLNDCNFVLHRGKAKATVVHIDRMRKLPIPPNAELEECPANDKHPITATTNQSTKQLTSSETEGTSTHCVER